MIDSSFACRGGSVFSKVDPYLGGRLECDSRPNITIFNKKPLHLCDVPRGDASVLDSFIESDEAPEQIDARTPGSTSDGELGIRRCQTVQDFEKSSGHDQGSESLALVPTRSSESLHPRPSFSIGTTPPSSSCRAERRLRGDELLDALLEKQQAAAFKRIETRKQIAKEKAMQEPSGSIPQASQPPMDPIGATLKSNAPSEKETPAKKAKLDVAEKLTPAKVGKLKMEFARTRDQYLVRSGIKGAGQNKSFKFGPPPARYATKEDAEAAARKHYRTLIASQLAASG